MGETNISRHNLEDALVIRSGGLGDFLLTLPFLKTLRQRSRRLTVLTRRVFSALVGDELPDTCWMDIDGPEAASLFGRPKGSLCERVRGAHVFSFLGAGDLDFRANLQTCGCASMTFLNSRPAQAPHVTEQMFAAAGMEPPPDLRNKAWLSRTSAGGKHLWVHPGSGSPHKNAPLLTFRKRIWELMSKDSFEGVRVLLGEAERGMHDEVGQAFAEWHPRMLVEPGLSELRRLMESSAGRFLGNDSGPSHLAAMLGIPSEIFFVATNPEIWRPLGPVTTIRDAPVPIPNPSEQTEEAGGRLPRSTPGQRT